MRVAFRRRQLTSDSEAYYLSRGFERPVAQYLAHGRRRILAVIPNNDFTLTLGFDNGERRLLDMKPIFAKNPAFNFIRNIDTFRRAYLDAEHCVAWDIDPLLDNSKVWGNKVELCTYCCYLESIPLRAARK